ALGQVLPEYMVPSQVLVLSELPVNVNGKVDRKALPLPAQQTEGYVAPEGEVEGYLAQLWAELLGKDVAEIGRQANFFRLGGHSLLAARMVAAVSRRFGCQLNVAQVFKTPLLSQLAVAVVPDVAADIVQITRQPADS